jgi:hypothetical protein
MRTTLFFNWVHFLYSKWRVEKTCFFGCCALFFKLLHYLYSKWRAGKTQFRSTFQSFVSWGPRGPKTPQTFILDAFWAPRTPKRRPKWSKDPPPRAPRTPQTFILNDFWAPRTNPSTNEPKSGHWQHQVPWALIALRTGRQQAPHLSKSTANLKWPRLGKLYSARGDLENGTAQQSEKRSGAPRCTRCYWRPLPEKQLLNFRLMLKNTVHSTAFYIV